MQSDSKAFEESHPQDSDDDDEEDWTPDPIDADPSKRAFERSWAWEPNGKLHSIYEPTAYSKLIFFKLCYL